MEFTHPIYQPRLPVDVGYEISLISYDGSISDRDLFMMWLTERAAENGEGEHCSTYEEEGKGISVKYAVVCSSMSHNTEFLKAGF